MLEILMIVLAQDAEVREAVGKASDWTSYKMICEDTVEEKVDGGGSKSNTDPSQVVFEKDKGLWLKAGRNESITVDGKTVARGKDGAWAVKAPKKSKNPGPPPVALPPHQSLRGLEKSSRVDVVEENENRIYTIALQPEGAVSILGNLAKDAAKATKEPECSAQLVVDKDGRIVKLEISLAFITASKSGEEKSITVKRVVKFTEVNEAKIEIPEEAKKALEAN